MTIVRAKISIISTPSDTFLLAPFIPMSISSMFLLSSILTESYLLMQ